MKLKDQVINDPDFLPRVVTGDESWIYGTILKQIRNRPHRILRLHPGRRKRGKWKARRSQCWSAFSTLMGLCIRNFSLQVILLLRSFTATSEAEAAKWTNNCVLHHDNAPAHTALAVRQLLASKNRTVVLHPITHLIYPPWLLPLPENQNQVEWAKI
jgi:hypothetical protein